MNSIPLKNYFVITTLILIVAFASECYAQSTDSAKKSFNTEFYTTFYQANGSHPFWHTSNQFGILTKAETLSWVSGIRMHSNEVFRISSGAWFSGGMHGVSRLSMGANSLHFQEFFAAFHYSGFKLSAGRFHHPTEILEPILSTGSMMISNNAIPVKRIMLSTDGYRDIPFTRGIFQFHATYSDGVLEENRHVKHARLHHKSFHLKTNLFMFEIMTGFIHNVQWGGTDPERGRLPMGFGDYIRIVTGQRAELNSGATEYEENNRLGNTIASYDGSMIVHLGNNHQLLAYRQIYLEDTHSLALRSYMDGLFGLGYRNLNTGNMLDAIIIEHVNTIRQDSFSDAPKGRGNYYNHYVYQSGWSHYNSAIGNPLLTFDPSLGRFSNNMVLAWHTAFRGYVHDQVSYTFKATYSRNYLTCRDQIIFGSCIITDQFPPDENLTLIPRNELRQDQYSFLVEGVYNHSTLPGYRFKVSLAYDNGTLLGNRFGLMIGVSVSDFHR